jgi:gentisate 1,2-dioxygenase
MARFGSGLLPVGHRAGSPNSPVFNYPWDRTREALHTLARGAEPDRHTGHLMRYVNPVDGGWAMPTIAAMVRLLPAGFATRPYRSTDAMVFVGVEGRGTLQVGGAALELGPRDIAVVPGWLPYSLQADAGDDWALFSYSDRVVHEKLGFWREQRDPA